MRVPARVTFLGTGTSQGVPVIACECSVCRSTDPRDQRLRPSVYVEVPGHANLLVDITPDFRQQALRYRIRRIDAVLFTHAHADHILGFDEIRQFNFLQGGPVPCYASGFCFDILKRTFYYAFDGIPRLGGGVPQVHAHEVGSEPFTVEDLQIVPVPLWHGRMPILGFRLGGFAYLTDCNHIPDESWELVAGVDTLVIDALRDQPHTTHFTVAEAVEAIARIAPRRAYLTHMTHDLGYVETSARLPAGVQLAYDGLKLDVDVEVTEATETTGSHGAAE